MTIHPARVQLNTGSWLPPERWRSSGGLFAGLAEVVPWIRRGTACDSADGRNAGDQVLTLPARRPATVRADIAAGPGLAPHEVLRHRDGLFGTGAVRAERRDDGVFYARVRTP